MTARGITSAAAAFLLASCVSVGPGAITPSGDNIDIPKGPPIEDIVTPFDSALECLSGKVPSKITFAVGQVADTTGKEQYADGGTGKLVTQGAGDMVQSALFRAGLNVVNRRDPNIPLAENNWGIRSIKEFTPAHFYLSGSITSLDFIPGGGAELRIAGVGPRYRQNRILVGLDLAMTDSFTGVVVANVPLQKQVYAAEMGFSTDRIFGQTLVNLDAGGMEREALQFTLRQMLSYATLELLGQVVAPADFAPCAALTGPLDAAMGDAGTRRRHNAHALADAMAHATEAERLAAEARAAASANAAAAQTGNMPKFGQPTGPDGKPVQSPPEAKRLANVATTQAALAIAAGERAVREKDPEQARKAAAESIQYTALAMRALREAAAAGLTGPEGDAAATVVEQAMKVSQAAKQMVDQREAPQAQGPSAPLSGDVPPSAQPAAPAPTSPQDKRLGGTGE